MKVLLINTTDTQGGAALAIYKIHKKFIEFGIDSTLLVLKKYSKEEGVVKLPLNNSYFNRIYKGLYYRFLQHQMKHHSLGSKSGFPTFSDDRTVYGNEINDFIAKEKYDIILLNWIHDFVDLGSLFLKLPAKPKFVWRLADINALTGGCHIAFQCKKYNEQCGSCPQLAKPSNHDFSSEIFKRKKRYFDSLNTNRLHFISLSKWMKKDVQTSPIISRFQVQLIQNGVDRNVFVPANKTHIRHSKGIPQDKFVVLIMSYSLNDTVKGYRYSEEVTRKLSGNKRIVFLAVGENSVRSNEYSNLISLGLLEGEKNVAEAYQAADLYLFTSIHDNHPNTVIEALACGVPVIGFNAYGVPDLVEEGVNGHLFELYDTNGMAQKIEQLSNDFDDMRRMGKNAVDRVRDNHDINVQAKKYLTYFKEILS
jgi:glycosyltransferase involved in cell wall biosynthesis